MVDLKEIKSIQLAPFTRMSASIYAILAFIAAIFMLITLSIVQAFSLIPNVGFFTVVGGIGLPLIVLMPLAAFLITLSVSFLTITLYNLLAPRLGGVELELDGSEVTKIPIVSFALILAAIQAIWALIAGLFMVGFANIMTTFVGDIIPAISNEVPKFTNTTFPIGPTGMPAGSEMAIISVLLIIGMPIIVFVFGFIWNALFAIFYNYIVTRVAKINLEFNQIKDNLHELKHIPVIPTALAVAIVYAIFGLFGFITGNFGEFISNFILYFIETALIAILYNYLAPKIGSIKLNLE